MNLTFESMGRISSSASIPMEAAPRLEFSITLIHDGVSYDFTKALCTTIQAPTKVDKYNDIGTLDLGFAGLELLGLPVPSRGDYIIFNTITYPNWFTGYVVDNPSPTYLGRDHKGTRQWHYTVLFNSDDYLLNLQSMPVNKVYINTSVGGIIKDLANTLLPGVFDLQNVQDGPLVGKYVLDPQNNFSAVVKDLAGNAYYRYYGKNKALYFYPIDDVPTTVTVDGNDPFFNASQLQATASTDPVLNDVTVFGQPEPQGVMDEYFLGDGYTGEFQLATSMFGVAEETILNEQFTSQGIDSDTWTVYDSIEGYLQVSQGYLNCLGGTATNSYDVFLQSNDPLPLEGQLRITHGQYDFTQQSSGLLGALYTDLPSAPVNGVFPNHLYSLMIAPGANGSSVLYPVVNGVIDTSQSLAVTNYNYRYTARTIISCSNNLRNPQTYRSFNEDGTTADLQFATLATQATLSTFIAVVDPNTGAIQDEVTFTSSLSLDGETLYAFYSPFVSNNLFATVTGITVSQPIQGSLQLKSLEHPTFTIKASGGDIFYTQDQLHLIGTTVDASVDWIMNCRIDSITEMGTGNEKAGLCVRLQSDSVNSGGVGPNVCLLIQPNGLLIMRYREAAGQDEVNLSVADQDSGVTDGLVLPQYFQLQKAGQVYTGFYSSDGYSWTQFAQQTMPAGALTGALVAGVCVTGQTTGVQEQVTAVIQELNFNGSQMTVNYESDIGIPSSWQSGYSTNTLNWTTQTLGVNELDTLDGMAPDATVVQLSNSVTTNANSRGSYQYNPGQCTLEYFSDSTTQTTNVPDAGDLIHLRYQRAGTSFARVVDWDAVIEESVAWQTSGFRSSILSNVDPMPRTSDECSTVAAATINSSGWQHYDGTYTQYSGYSLPFEPVAGGIIAFQNLTGDIKDIKQEIMQQVESIFIANVPSEIFTHTISFGKLDLAQKFLARVSKPTGVTIPEDTAYIPPAVDLDAYDDSILPNVIGVQFTGQTRTNWNFSIEDSLAEGQSFEVRTSDDSWGCDAGRNLITRIPFGSPTTFSTSRTANGRTAFARKVDARNIITYSEDLTQWTTSPGVTITNIKAQNPEGFISQVSSVTITGQSVLYLLVPASAAQGSPASAMAWIKGPAGAPAYMQAVAFPSNPGSLSDYLNYYYDTPAALLGYGNDAYSEYGYGSPANWSVNGYGFSAYGEQGYGDLIWSLYVSNVLNGYLTGGWDFLRASDALFPFNTEYVMMRVLLSTPGTYLVTRVSMELSDVNTVYCRTNGSPYGASSRFSAGAKTSLPLIPPPPSATVDITDPVNPVISVILPANMTDVWGYEVRDSDNVTVLAKANYGQSDFGLGYDMTVTVNNNTSRNRNFYCYTFNLLNEYSDPFILDMLVPEPVAGGMQFSDEYFTMSFSGGRMALANPELVNNTSGTTPNVPIPLNGAVTDNWVVNVLDPPFDVLWQDGHDPFAAPLAAVLIRLVPQRSIPANGIFYGARVFSERIPVTAGQQVIYEAISGLNALQAFPAGLTVEQRVGVFFYDVNGNQILELYPPDYDVSQGMQPMGVSLYATATAPSNAASVCLQLAGFVRNGTVNPITVPGTIADMYFSSPSLAIVDDTVETQYDVDVRTGTSASSSLVWSGTVTTPLAAFKELDYLNLRYITITPYDTLGAGKTVTISHVYLPPPPIECDGDEVFTVSQPTTPGTGPTIPPSLPGHAVTPYVNESLKNYSINLNGVVSG